MIVKNLCLFLYKFLLWFFIAGTISDPRDLEVNFASL